MMIRPTEKQKKDIDRLCAITKNYPELFDRYYNNDSMEINVSLVPQELKKVANEYNDLLRKALTFFD